MARIAVFDSGLGSLSVIRAIRRAARSEIIYFADRENFPYGGKSRRQLGRIVQKTVKMLQEGFAPDVIVMASNTPSLMVEHDRRRIIGVYPPVKAAAGVSATKSIAVLGTRSASGSRALGDYIARQGLPRGTAVHRIDASPLVELVETGRFLTDRGLCRKKIRGLLGEKFRDGDIDAATLSSTHLPFLKPLLRSEFPGVSFLDPAEDVAARVAEKIKGRPGGQNRLRIYASGDVRAFEENMARLGIRNRVGRLSI